MATFNDVKDWKPEYLEGENPEETRLIGIEFEARPKALDKIKDDKFKIIRDEVIDEHKNYSDPERPWVYDMEGRKISAFEFVREELEKVNILVGGVGQDGGGREFVTYPDSIGCYVRGGSERLKNVIDMLSSATDADAQSGTHINVSKLATDTKTTWNNIYWFCMCFGPQLQKIFGRRTHWAQIPMPKEYYSGCSGGMEYNYIFEAPQKRPEIDKFSVYQKGSIVVDKGNRYEFRGPKATHDLDEVLGWVQICNNIVDLCANGYIKDMTFSEVLKGKYARAYLAKIEKNPNRKITSEERASKISNIGYVKIVDKGDKIL